MGGDLVLHEDQGYQPAKLLVEMEDDLGIVDIKSCPLGHSEVNNSGQMMITPNRGKDKLGGLV